MAALVRPPVAAGSACGGGEVIPPREAGSRPGALSMKYGIVVVGQIGPQGRPGGDESRLEGVSLLKAVEPQ
jgi:hypothetical protein